ncbi:ArsR/SmtB family transcription factor [Salidesulfovibrio onnuriiensis]|uniref:ArsR/SmtB family transcription factor n=1 Tax=Salidesulfovibrio onnuriiensis TaxID=2583823 RepID=UPI00202B8240|nr:metalloregulator ArsR/SmtB family transcription factor [Salidesulfovibrio onnuriiensis]
MLKQMESDKSYELTAEVFKAMGHPARLAMLAALGQGEQCVCELQKLVELDMSTVSRHLAVLKRAGVVSSRKQGNWAYYRLELECVGAFIDCIETAKSGKKTRCSQCRN